MFVEIVYVFFFCGKIVHYEKNLVKDFTWIKNEKNILYGQTDLTLKFSVEQMMWRKKIKKHEHACLPRCLSYHIEAHGSYTGMREVQV